MNPTMQKIGVQEDPIYVPEEAPAVPDTTPEPRRVPLPSEDPATAPVEVPA